jgi:hypothetical protein
MLFSSLFRRHTVSSFGSEAVQDGLAAAAVAHPAAAWLEGKARLHRAQKIAALGGLLAGLASFGIGEAIYGIIPPKLVKQKDMMSGKMLLSPSIETLHIARATNAALAFGALGLCLGGLLGVAGGLARRSTSATVTAGLLGAISGSVLGAGVSRALLPFVIKTQHDFHDNDVIIALISHGLIWGLVGASAGSAFAVGLGERRLIGRALTAGLMGAVLGAVAYEMIGAVFFTSANTNYPISETWPTRLMARLLVTIGTAAALFFLTEPPDVVAEHQTDSAAPSPQS